MNAFWFLIISFISLIVSYVLTFRIASKFARLREEFTAEGEFLITKKSALLSIAFAILGLALLAFGLLFCYVSFMHWRSSSEIGVYSWLFEALARINTLLDEDHSVFSGLFIKASFSFTFSLVCTAIIVILLLAHSVLSGVFVLAGDGIFVAVMSNLFGASFSKSILRNVGFVSLLGLLTSFMVTTEGFLLIGALCCYTFICGLRIAGEAKAFSSS
jgi:hypothetical protein